MILKELNNNIGKFINNLAEDNYSYFKYSLTGDIYKKNIKWGLGNLVFATKLLYIAGLFDEIDYRKKENIYKNILKFSKNGYLYDPIITRLNLKERLKKVFGKLDKIKVEHIENTKRAETRQSFAALHLLMKKPKKPFLHIPYTKEGINNYLSSFNWSYPWAAGSHFSHLLFFLYMNSIIFKYKVNESKELIKYAVDWIGKIQSKDDGCWYRGSISLKEKINGAMKIFTGLHAVNIYNCKYSKKLIDTALSAINDKDACSNFNIVYVLYGCNKIEPEYRKDEIRDFLLKRVDIYKEYYHCDKDGFSFFKDRANDIYYGKKISEGKNEPDIHGTIMFIWGLSIINKIIDIGLDFKVPLN